MSDSPLATTDPLLKSSMTMRAAIAADERPLKGSVRSVLPLRPTYLAESLLIRLAKGIGGLCETILFDRGEMHNAY